MSGVLESGVSAKIRKLTRSKNGREYTSYLVDYILLGARRRETHIDF